ncbi:MAG: hypothetical protein JWN60_1872 [Acidobacteria bacterium]|nr:hypothetical protein [Acidobacteriota bacterium]
MFFASFSSIRAQGSIYELQSGTKISLRMETEINSKVSSVNDTFITKISKPVIVRETIVLPVGTIVEGRVVKVSPSSVGGQSGKIEVVFENMRFADGTKRNIEGALVDEIKADSAQKSNVLTIAGGAALGAIFGGVSKTENGALIGAGLGAGAGTGIALLRKGKNVRIKTDEEFEIELKKTVVLPVMDY